MTWFLLQLVDLRIGENDNEPILHLGVSACESLLVKEQRI